jgi:hypothetical protein
VTQVRFQHRLGDVCSLMLKEHDLVIGGETKPADPVCPDRKKTAIPEVPLPVYVLRRAGTVPAKEAREQ